MSLTTPGHLYLVTDYWSLIPVHYNFDGNEESGRIAREGSALSMTSPKPAVCIISAARKSRIKLRIHETFHNITVPHGL